MAEEPYETAALAVEEPEAATRRRLLAEIAACRADPMKMLMHQRPITMAIMMALTRPASEVLDLAEESFTTPAATDMSAIEALGIAAVGSALRGSTNAAAFITERLEGRAVHHDPARPTSVGCGARGRAAGYRRHREGLHRGEARRPGRHAGRRRPGGRGQRHNGASVGAGAAHQRPPGPASGRAADAGRRWPHQRPVQRRRMARPGAAAWALSAIRRSRRCATPLHGRKRPGGRPTSPSAAGVGRPGARHTATAARGSRDDPPRHRRSQVPTTRWRIRPRIARRRDRRRSVAPTRHQCTRASAVDNGLSVPPRCGKRSTFRSSLRRCAAGRTGRCSR